MEQIKFWRNLKEEKKKFFSNPSLLGNLQTICIYLKEK